MYKRCWIRIRRVMIMSDFEDYLSHTLDELTPSVVVDAMKYSLMAGGKRIRPSLLFHALQAYGVEAEKGYSAAAAIEMIHTYSLIHDDLPAMDNDTLRRGRATCHVKYGEAIAILAGDALLTQAFSQLSSASETCGDIANMMKLLADYSGADGMVLGQVKDLQGEGNSNIQVDDLKDIHVYKTGKLLTLPLLFAAILAGHQEDLVIWDEVGKYIGLSFQIQDDVLDVTSSSEILGKNINSDAENEKSTYVSLMGIDEAKKSAEHYYDKAWDLVDILNIEHDCMKPVFELLSKRNK